MKSGRFHDFSGKYNATVSHDRFVCFDRVHTTTPPWLYFKFYLWYIFFHQELAGAEGLRHCGEFVV